MNKQERELPEASLPPLPAALSDPILENIRSGSEYFLQIETPFATYMEEQALHRPEGIANTAASAVWSMTKLILENDTTPPAAHGRDAMGTRLYRVFELLKKQPGAMQAFAGYYGDGIPEEATAPLENTLQKWLTAHIDSAEQGYALDNERHKSIASTLTDLLPKLSDQTQTSLLQSFTTYAESVRTTHLLKIVQQHLSDTGIESGRIAEILDVAALKKSRQFGAAAVTSEQMVTMRGRTEAERHTALVQAVRDIRSGSDSSQEAIALLKNRLTELSETTDINFDDTEQTGDGIYQNFIEPNLARLFPDRQAFADFYKMHAQLASKPGLFRNWRNRLTQQMVNEKRESLVDKSTREKLRAIQNESGTSLRRMTEGVIHYSTPEELLNDLRAYFIPSSLAAEYFGDEVAKSGDEAARERSKSTWENTPKSGDTMLEEDVIPKLKAMLEGGQNLERYLSARPNDHVPFQLHRNITGDQTTLTFAALYATLRNSDFADCDVRITVHHSEENPALSLSLEGTSLRRFGAFHNKPITLKKAQLPEWATHFSPAISKQLNPNDIFEQDVIDTLEQEYRQKGGGTTQPYGQYGHSDEWSIPYNANPNVSTFSVLRTLLPNEALYYRDDADNLVKIAEKGSNLPPVNVKLVHHVSASSTYNAETDAFEKKMDARNYLEHSGLVSIVAPNLTLNQLDRVWAAGYMQ